MDQLVLADVGERFGHLAQYGAGFFERQAALFAQELLDRAAIHELHGEVDGFGFFAADDAVDDVGMIKLGGESRFAEKSLFEGFVRGQFRKEDL